MAFRDLRALPGDTDNKLFQKIADSLAIQLGQRGHDLYSAAGVHVGEWVWLHAITAATVTIIRDGVTETFSLAATDKIFGQITSVNVTAGTAELYRDN